MRRPRTPRPGREPDSAALRAHGRRADAPPRAAAATTATHADKADKATSADNATHADSATNADHATAAVHAETSDQLGSHGPDDFALANHTHDDRYILKGSGGGITGDLSVSGKI